MTPTFKWKFKLISGTWSKGGSSQKNEAGDQKLHLEQELLRICKVEKSWISVMSIISSFGSKIQNLF